MHINKYLCIYIPRHIYIYICIHINIFTYTYPIRLWHVADSAPGSEVRTGLGMCLANTTAKAEFCMPVSILYIK
jgi:hypothetical protein